MTKFDYKIVVLPVGVQKVEEELNTLGNQGWELIAVDFEARRYIFKMIRYHENSKAKN